MARIWQMEDLLGSLSQTQQKLQEVQDEVELLRENAKNMGASGQQLLLENEALRREMDAIHEELRSQDAFRTSEMIRTREEVEGLRSFAQHLQLQLSRLVISPLPGASKTSAAAAAAAAANKATKHSPSPNGSAQQLQQQQQQQQQQHQRLAEMDPAKQGNKL